MSATDLLEIPLYGIWANDCYFFSEHYVAGLQALARSKGLSAEDTDSYIDHIMPDLWECLHEAKDTVTGSLMGHVSDQAVAGFIDLVAVELGYTIYGSLIEVESGEPPQQKTVSYTKSGLDDKEGCFTFYGKQHAQENSHYKCTRYTLDVEKWASASDLKHIGENPNQVLPTNDDKCFTNAVCRSLEEDPEYDILNCNTSESCDKIKMEPGKSDPDVKVETDYSSTSHTLSDIPVKSGCIKKEPGVD